MNKGYSVKPYIGVGVTNVNSSKDTKTNDDVTEGAYVQKVYEDSPAESAGIKAGDIITEINGKTIKSSSELISTVRAASKDDKLVCKVYRDGEYTEITVTVTEQKSDSASDEDNSNSDERQYSQKQGRSGSDDQYSGYGDFEGFGDLPF